MIVERNSILARTGQAWKINLMYGGGIAAVLTGMLGYFVDALFPLVHIGGLGGIACLVFPTVSVKCPSCRARWLWLAFKSESGQNLVELMKRPTCGVCGLKANIYARH